MGKKILRILVLLLFVISCVSIGILLFAASIGYNNSVLGISSGALFIGLKDVCFSNIKNKKF